MRKISPEDYNDLLRSVCTHAGMSIFMEEVDVIINRIRDGIHGCQLTNDPNSDGLKLLGERQKLEGAIALKNAMKHLIAKAKEKDR